MFSLRDKLYAHTDETDNRVAADPFGMHRYTEGYRLWKPEAFDIVEELARSQEGVFRQALTEREDALRDAGVPTEPLR